MMSKLTQEQITNILEGVNKYYNTKKYVTFYHIIEVIIGKKEEKLLYIKNNFNNTRKLYIIDADKIDLITNRVNKIIENVTNSTIRMRNYKDIKEQTKHIINEEGRALRNGLYMCDVAYRGFMTQQNIYMSNYKKDRFVSVLPNKKIINKWFDFPKYAKLKELKSVWKRGDVVIFNSTEEVVVSAEEAIEKVLNGDNIEIHYLSEGETKDNATIQFENVWYVNGDIFGIDDFVYSQDEQRLIESSVAVWCDDVEDYRHIDDTYTDYYGDIYGEDDNLIYSEEKEYYIRRGNEVKIYEDIHGNFFYVHCDDVDDYYFWESDDEYHTEEEEEFGLIKKYGKTELNKLDKGDKPYFIGVELEMELDGHYQSDIEYKLETAMHEVESVEYYLNLIEFKEDGSLDDGVEMVTAPTNLEQFKKDIVPLIQELQKKGFTSEVGGRCGNHIHISRDIFSEDAQARLVLIYAKFESLIKILSRRNGKNNYCQDVLDTVSGVSLELSDTIVKRQKAKSKFTAINFNNTNTIEFRVFRGTMNTNVLIANIQLVQLIADLALQELSIQNILDLNFSQLVNKMVDAEYNELIAYCEKKGLLD